MSRRRPGRADLLPPELLDELGDLEWVGRLVARGVGPGIHRSIFVGRGEEFERHRPYQQGDDLRHLDWRLLARTDRLHVRRFRESSNLRAVLVIDASPSMDFAGGGEGRARPPGRDAPDGGSFVLARGGRERRGRPAGVTKLRYAALLAAALGHLARSAGDRPGLLVTGSPSGNPAALLPPRPGREAWHAFLHALTRLEAGAPGSLAPYLERAAGMLPRGGRCVILSDFLEDDGGEATAAAAGHLRARGDEVTAVRILTPEELGEGAGGDAVWTDPERPDRRVPGDPARDASYRSRLDFYYRALARDLEHRGVLWREARTTDPLLPLLRGWLAREAG